jgi:hypothetical protein
MILGFGFDYWWTNALGAIEEVEEDDDDWKGSGNLFKAWFKFVCY